MEPSWAAKWRAVRRLWSVPEVYFTHSFNFQTTSMSQYSKSMPGQVGLIIWFLHFLLPKSYQNWIPTAGCWRRTHLRIVGPKKNDNNWTCRTHRVIPRHLGYLYVQKMVIQRKSLSNHIEYNPVHIHFPQITFYLAKPCSAEKHQCLIQEVLRSGHISNGGKVEQPGGLRVSVASPWENVAENRFFVS